ncbi:MAG: hypothetical protein HY725_03920, partial [Candidatus Rokubacteria bacterium]|nr:hypothetical protein [Candidatus Rokubacteria bacterium]
LVLDELHRLLSESRLKDKDADRYLLSVFPNMSHRLANVSGKELLRQLNLDEYGIISLQEGRKGGAGFRLMPDDRLAGFNEKVGLILL